jgi:hypothetical protein
MLQRALPEEDLSAVNNFLGALQPFFDLKARCLRVASKRSFWSH